MGTRTSSESGKRKTSRGPRKQTAGTAIQVDPASNRPANADESTGEALIPEIVRANLVSQPTTESALDRDSRIAERAYQLASERGFTPGAELEDWLRAEQEIDAQTQSS